MVRKAWIGVGGVIAAMVATVAVLAGRTAAEVQALRTQVLAQAAAHPAPPWQPAALASLPAPVQRWAAYTFRAAPPAHAWVDYQMRGDFRRPLTTTFQPTTARQLAAIGVPAMVFDATTPVFGLLWARAYDGFVDGHMTMRAAILSALTVMDEPPSATLDRISLRRWLIESAMYPAALLPGGPVRWEAVDARHARAVVRLGAVQATLMATFADDGRLLQFDAEQDGDLGTPYHGSGEQFVRDDDRLVQGMMIPHRFRVARVAGGKTYPFWQGEITALRYGLAGERP